MKESRREALDDVDGNQEGDEPSKAEDDPEEEGALFTAMIKNRGAADKYAWPVYFCGLKDGDVMVGPDDEGFEASAEAFADDIKAAALDCVGEYNRFRDEGREKERRLVSVADGVPPEVYDAYKLLKIGPAEMTEVVEGTYEYNLYHRPGEDG